MDTLFERPIDFFFQIDDQIQCRGNDRFGHLPIVIHDGLF